jgi:predicted Zn-dependent protease
LAGLRAYPEDHGVRFILARVLFELGYLKLAAKELLEVKRNFPNDQTFFQLSERLERLLSNQPRSPQPVSTVLAEAQFDLDEIAKFDQSKERK